MFGGRPSGWALAHILVIDDVESNRKSPNHIHITTVLTTITAVDIYRATHIIHSAEHMLEQFVCRQRF